MCVFLQLHGSTLSKQQYTIVQQKHMFDFGGLLPVTTFLPDTYYGGTAYQDPADQDPSSQKSENIALVN